MDFSQPNMAQKLINRKSSIKRMFKRFLLAKYKTERDSSKYEYDPIEKLSEEYCIHGKRTSDISLFQDRLFKTELTNEYLFNALKNKLKGVGVLEDLLDVDIPRKKLQVPALSDCMLLYIFDKLKTGGIASDTLISKWKTKIKNRSKKYNKNRPNKSNIYINSTEKKKNPCEQALSTKLGRSDSSSTLSSDPQKRLEKFSFYPIALDQFGNRLENYRLPEESVHRLLINLINSSNENSKLKCMGASVNRVDNILKSETDTKKDGPEKNITHRVESVSSNESVIQFTDKNLQNLFERKAKVKKDIESDTSLLSLVQKVKPDRKGWNKNMCLSLDLMKLGNNEEYNEICKEIGDVIMKKIKDEERAKVKYWSLLYGDGEETKGKLINTIEPTNKDKLYKNKKYTYKTMNEYMFSRDYDENTSQIRTDEEGSDSDVSFDTFQLHVLKKIETDLPSEDAAGFCSFFDVPTDRDEDVHTETDINNIEEFERFPIDPYLDEKTSYLSRLTQVRGRIVNNDELSKPPAENMYPFGSKTSRGLSPIQRFKTNGNCTRKELLDEEDRRKFIKTDGRKNVFKQSKRLCELPVTQSHYNWESSKILGKQVLPGTDIFIQAPKIKELKEEEDSWKYNLPPFDYMTCGLPKDSFELVSNQILQKEILEQELMDMEREEFETKKVCRSPALDNKDTCNNIKQRGISSFPPPWQYDIKRWPQTKSKLISNSLSQSNFISQVINKHNVRDSKTKYINSSSYKRQTNSNEPPIKEEILPVGGIKYWRNISLERLKTKEA